MMINKDSYEGYSKNVTPYGRLPSYFASKEVTFSLTESLGLGGQEGIFDSGSVDVRDGLHR